MQSAQVCPKELSIRWLVTQDQDDGGKEGKKGQAGKRRGGTFFTPAARAEVTIRACCFLFYTFPPLVQVLLGHEPSRGTEHSVLYSASQYIQIIRQGHQGKEGGYGGWTCGIEYPKSNSAHIWWRAIQLRRGAPKLGGKQKVHLFISKAQTNFPQTWEDDFLGIPCLALNYPLI